MTIDELVAAATTVLSERQRSQEEKREVERRRAVAIESGLRDLLTQILPGELFSGVCIPAMDEYTYSAASSEYWASIPVHPPERYDLNMAPFRVRLRYRDSKGWDMPTSHGVFSVATYYRCEWDAEPGWYVLGSDYRSTDDLVEAVSYSLEMYAAYCDACADAARRNDQEAVLGSVTAQAAQELTPNCDY